jgi:hypothetical protein
MIKNMEGIRIGRLLILEDTGKRYNREVIWKCICDCGNITEVKGGHLRTGMTQSCGCLSRETREKYNNLRHKYKTNNLKILEVMNNDTNK